MGSDPASPGAGGPSEVAFQVVDAERRAAWLEATVFAATTFLRNPDLDAGFSTLLERLGRATGVDRAYVFETSETADGDIVSRYIDEWVSDSRYALLGKPILASVSLKNRGALADEWVKRRRRGEVIQAHVRDLDGFLREILTQTAVRSLVTVPIMVRGRWWGTVGFDDCRSERTWLPEEVHVLEVAASVLGAAIERSHLDSEIRRHKDELEVRVAERTRELQILATTDSLTGAANRRRFLELASYELERVRRYRPPATLIVADIDFFKKVNDAHGHAAGDAVLRTVGGLWIKTLRTMDCLGRIGGEEFAILLPQTPEADGAAVAEKLRRRLEETEVPVEGGPLRVTASFGVTALRPDDALVETPLHRADTALYSAKRDGRNRVVTAS
ncbi:MAG: sensor domain-containing diguanylate cyclase [Alphaproteobacteria bacterium]|nr:sensor domain-containing diguanylate cyclase [Alphaproteobacteria bacterium]